MAYFIMIGIAVSYVVSLILTFIALMGMTAFWIHIILGIPYAQIEFSNNFCWLTFFISLAYIHISSSIISKKLNQGI